MSELDKTIPQLNLYPENSPISGAELIYMTKNGEDWALNLSRLYASATPSAHGLISSTHTITGKTTGHFLRAKAGDTYDFEELLKTDVLPLLSDWLTLEGTAPNQYVACKFPFASVGDITAFASSGYVLPSLWDSLLIATANVLGGIKVGSGLAINNGVLSVSGNFASTWGTITGTLSNQTDLNSALGLKADLVNGLIPSNQLPSYVDDVLEYAAYANLPATGESGKIYITQDTNLTYRWSGSGYAEISASLAIGETASTAYRGDRGKTAYDHSQASHQAILNGTGFVKVSGTTISYDNSTYSLSNHVHGNITNTGYLGSTANIPLITGTGGIIQAGSFGTAANTFCQGNDSRLSDSRTPVSHTLLSHTVTGKTTGHFLKAKAGDTYDFEALTATEVKTVLTDWFEYVANSGNPYLRVKLPIGCDGEIQAFTSSGQFPQDIWASLPQASTSAYGVVKIGSGIGVTNGVISVTSGAGMVYPAGSGIAIVNAGSWGTTITDNSSQWNAAYSHSQASHAYLPLSGGGMTGTINLHSMGGTTGFENGTGDGANYTTYNLRLSGWNGLAFYNPTSGGAYPAQVSGVMDFRNGILDMKGGFAVNGNAVWHTGNLTPSNYQLASTAINTSNIGSQSVNYALNADILAGYYHSDFFHKKGATSGNLDNDLVEGSYYYVPTTTNNPNGSYGTLLTVTGGIGWYNQIAFGTNKIDLKWRSSINDNTSFDSWKDIYNSANSNISTVDWSCYNLYAYGTKIGINTTTGFNAISGNEGTLFINSGNVASIYLKGGGKKHSIYSSSGGLYFYNITDNTYPFSILDNGDTGFGTTTPTAKITIGRVTGVASINASSDAGGHVVIDSYNASGQVYLNNYHAGDVILASGGGKVAIGNITPTYKLHVDGSIYATVNLLSGGTNACYISGEEGGLLSSGDDYTIAKYVVASETFYFANANMSIGLAGGMSLTGNFTATGEVTAYYSSDSRFKINVNNFTGLDLIDQLFPKTYNWNDLAKGLNPMKGDSLQYGLIAQEVERVMPELVHTIYGKYKSIDYVSLIPVLLQAVKELKAEVNNLRNG